MKLHTTFTVEITVESDNEIEAYDDVREVLGRIGTARPLASEIVNLRFVSVRPIFTAAEERMLVEAQARYDSEA